MILPMKGPLCIAATGHRPQKLGGFQKFPTKLLYIADSYIKRNVPTLGISGMALGWDTVWAEALIELEVPFLAAIPFEGQESRWPQESQKKYHDLLKKADRVEIISPGGYAAWKMHVRNEWMVDNCDRVVALWDGGDDGGTAACVRYATKRKVPVDNLWDMYRQDLIS